MAQAQGTNSAYRWVVLVLYSMGNFLVSFCQFQPAFFAPAIMVDLGIDSTAFVLITASSMAPGIVLAFLSGTLADKFGLKKVILVGLILSTIGGFCRYLAPDYITLVLSVVLTGTIGAFVTANVTKLAVAWFKPSQIGLAVGVSLAIGGAGVMVAQAVTGVVFESYRQAFLWGGILLAVLAVLWAILGKERPAGSQQDQGPAQRVSMIEGIKQAVRSRNIWIAGIATLLFTGFNVVLNSFIITALSEVWGTDPVQAGFIGAVATLGCVLGSAFLPAIVTRSPHAKIFCILLPIISAASIFAGWNINNDIARIVLFLISGLCYGSFNPLAMLYPSVLPEISPRNVGGAGGLLTSLMLSGSLIVPYLIVMPLAGGDYNLMLVIDSLVCAAIAICFALLPSLSPANRAKMEAHKIGKDE